MRVRPSTGGPEPASLAARIVAGLLLGGGFAASSAFAAELAGTLTLVERGRPAADASAAVIWFVPAGGASRPAPVRAEIQTRNRKFIPSVIVVPAGSEVWFPNSDPILHNVFSVSPGNRFDLGLYRKGRGKAARLPAPGVVRIFCNVHQAMAAYAVVLDTPYSTRPGDDGRFVLDGLPAGPGTLHLWHERGEPTSRSIVVPANEPLELTLEIQPPSPIVHLDKHGRPYRTESRDDDYR